MNAVIYVRDNGDIPIYAQFNKCAEYAAKNGFPVIGKVLDFDGKHLHEAINKIIASREPKALIIYSIDEAFDNYNDYIFYRVYLETFKHRLIVCE